MIAMEKNEFEGFFKDAFANAEVAPSEQVWANVELELARAERDDMKRRVLFYKLMAAAAITFAMVVVGLGYYAVTTGFWTPSSAGYMAQQGGVAPNHSSSSSSSPSFSHEGDEAPGTPSSSTTARPLLSDAGGHNVDQQGTPNEVPQHLQANTQAETATTKSSSSPSSSIYSKDRFATGAKSNDKSFSSDEASASNRSVAMSSSRVDQYTPPIPAETSTNIVKEQQGSHHASAVVASALNNTGAGEMTASADKKTESTSEMTSTRAGRSLPPLYAQHDIRLTLQPVVTEPVADPVALMFARLHEREQELAQAEEQDKEEKSERETLWTSLGVAAGAFSAVNSNVSVSLERNALLASNTNVANNEARASGTTYSIGVNMGTQISRRWVLQGGVSYMTQSSDFTSNQVLGSQGYTSFRAATISALDQTDVLANSKVVTTAPYTVNNNIQFVSIPVQTGYLLVNRKFGLQLNAGIATDLFMQNTIRPEGLEKTTQSRGADSPYRSVNFSGLAGTEFSYKFSPRYRISLNPGLRYPFNSIYKADTGVSAVPLTFDVGLRFKYIFK